ncbi:MAG: bifunctional riboflavin kinase/FAD synthetase [Desulfovibrio sp.]|nr:bifunctional riboflavin kinase/FAD synthetase [Desulfovibrio sp.]
MQAYSYSANLLTKASAITIGNFDGIHRGHQTLLARTLLRAEEQNLQSVVITFWPHPRSVIAQNKSHCPLTSRERKLSLLRELGIEHIIEIPFTPAFAKQSPNEFVQNYLLPLQIKTLITGYDFCLGRNRSGHSAELSLLGKQLGFSVEQMPPFILDSEIVSSTRLRKMLLEGQIENANKLLGRAFELTGTVIHGFGRGTTLGFPTANLSKPETLLPACGVYAGYAKLDTQITPCVINIGHNPTFEQVALSIESYLFDIHQDLYGATMTLFFIAHLRDEQRFANPQALCQQINADIAKSRSLLKTNEYKPS